MEEAKPIIRKIIAKKEDSMSDQVSSRKPFGLPTNAIVAKSGNVKLRSSKGYGFFKRSLVPKGTELIDKWNVMVSKTSYDHAGQPDKEGKRRVFSVIDILPPKTICTETYLIAGTFNTKKEAMNLITYLKTRFVRFLISQLTVSHDITKDKFEFIPVQSFKESWTDNKLYKKYKLTKKEIDFIESKIHPME